jgi:hypothetical protein
VLREVGGLCAAIISLFMYGALGFALFKLEVGSTAITAFWITMKLEDSHAVTYVASRARPRPPPS